MRWSMIGLSVVAGLTVAYPDASHADDGHHHGLVRCADGAYRSACMTSGGKVVEPQPMAKPPPHCSAGVHIPGCVGVKGTRISRR